MIRSFASTEAFVAAAPMILLLVKVTLLMAFASLAAAAIQRQSAAARHFVWALAIAAALALPILVRLSPQVGFPVPAALEPSVRALLQSPSAGIRPDAQAGVARAPMSPAADPSAAASATTRRERAAGASPAIDPRAGSAGSTAEPTSTAANGPDASAAAIAASRSYRWLVLVWLAGGVAVLSRLALGHFGLARLARRALPLADDAWRSLLDDALARAHLSTRVRLCSSPSVGAPVTWGWTSPVVVLPAGAEAWPLERRRVALEHELAHVARRDYLTQLGGALVCAVYWFHPLVWFAARRLRVESEHACDDRVLNSGTSAPDYATHLLAVARGARRLRLAGAVAVCMARPSHLEGRLLSLLDDARPRGGLAARTRFAAMVSLGFIAILLAGLHPVARATEVGTRARSEEPGTRPASTVEKSIPASSGEHITLELDTGGDVDLRGWDEDRVDVRARLDGTDWRDTQVDVEREDGGVRVSSRLRGQKNGSSTSHAFEIRVPRRFDLHLRSAGGGVTIVGVEGSFRGQTGGGDIVLDHVQGDVRLSTGGGEILVTDTDARGHVSTGGGMVRMSRVRGGLRGSSGSGPVIYSEAEGDKDPGSGTRARSEVRLGDLEGVRVDKSGIEDRRTDAQGVLHIERAGGEVIIQEAPQGVDVTTGGGRIRVGRSGGRVEAKTGGGSIDIGPVAGSVVAGTGAGAVHVTLSDAHGEEQTVEISSGNGRIVVELPEGFDGEFDLETAYTRNHRGATRIESSWKLDREPTTDWDDSEGTPRRYVRARGVAGRGGGLVHVRTVNGDITLQRSRSGHE